MLSVCNRLHTASGIYAAGSNCARPVHLYLSWSVLFFFLYSSRFSATKQVIRPRSNILELAPVFFFCCCIVRICIVHPARTLSPPYRKKKEKETSKQFCGKGRWSHPYLSAFSEQWSAENVDGCYAFCGPTSDAWTVIVLIRVSIYVVWSRLDLLVESEKKNDRQYTIMQQLNTRRGLPSRFAIARQARCDYSVRSKRARVLIVDMRVT